MTWMASQLKERIQLMIGVQTENDEGGFDQTYTTLATLWAGLKPVKAGKYFRGVQTDKTITHEFLIRRSSIADLGTAFSSAFSSAYDEEADLMNAKGDYFIFLQRGSSSKGRLFRLHQAMDVEERREILKLLAEEIEEQGTGYPA